MDGRAPCLCSISVTLERQVRREINFKSGYRSAALASCWFVVRHGTTNCLSQRFMPAMALAVEFAPTVRLFTRNRTFTDPLLNSTAFTAINADTRFSKRPCADSA